MLRRCPSIAHWAKGAATAALVVLVVLPAAARAESPFRRAAQELSSAASSLGSTLFDAASAVMGGTGSSADAEAPSAFQAKVDAWATNPTLKIGRRLLKMDGLSGMGSFMEEMLMGKELEQVFSDPFAAYTVINRECSHSSPARLGSGLGLRQGRRALEIGSDSRTPPFPLLARHLACS